MYFHGLMTLLNGCLLTFNKGIVGRPIAWKIHFRLASPYPLWNCGHGLRGFQSWNEFRIPQFGTGGGPFSRAENHRSDEGRNNATVAIAFTRTIAAEAAVTFSF